MCAPPLFLRFRRRWCRRGLGVLLAFVPGGIVLGLRLRVLRPAGPSLGVTVSLRARLRVVRLTLLAIHTLLLALLLIIRLPLLAIHALLIALLLIIRLALLAVHALLILVLRPLLLGFLTGGIALALDFPLLRFLLLRVGIGAGRPL